MKRVGKISGARKVEKVEKGKVARAGKSMRVKVGVRDSDVGYVKVCPKCKSINVKTNQQGGLAFFGLPTFYTCQDCGFTNNFFPEVKVGKGKR